MATLDAVEPCDGGTAVRFDGVRCVPSCERADGGDARVFATDLECVRSCQCNALKFHTEMPYEPETRCDWVRVVGWLDGGLSDAGYDGGTDCGRWKNDFFHCYAWLQPSGNGTGTPLGEAGVRTLCELSRRREVVSLYCELYLE